MESQTQIVRYAQPYEIKVKIVDKMNAKLETVPEIEVSISRKLEDDTQIIELIGSDIDKLIAKARNAMNKLKELG
jgi:PP-loop superfamily ATP-utilizing enzyme